VRRSDPGTSATHWRYQPDETPAFDPAVFDERALAARGALEGGASAGRGNTFYFTLDGYPLVLRHYRRGGLVRHLSERRYVWTGLERTRAVAEFEMLRTLHADGLPVPRPFACAVNREGPLWRGSLVTHRLPGETLAERLTRGELPAERWEAIGQCIARFHRAGVWHADLNASNIMLDRAGAIFLIDFDRARRRSAVATRWRAGNIRRLQRSLEKVGERGGRGVDETGFAVLERAWRAEIG